MRHHIAPRCFGEVQPTWPVSCPPEIRVDRHAAVSHRAFDCGWFLYHFVASSLQTMRPLPSRVSPRSSRQMRAGSANQRCLLAAAQASHHRFGVVGVVPEGSRPIASVTKVMTAYALLKSKLRR
jgi:hypothetical protein